MIIFLQISIIVISEKSNHTENCFFFFLVIFNIAILLYLFIYFIQNAALVNKKIGVKNIWQNI